MRTAYRVSMRTGYTECVSEDYLQDESVRIGCRVCVFEG